MVFNTHYQNLFYKEPANNYLTLRSFTGDDFSLKIGISGDPSPNWDGIMYYSTDTTNWNVWDGSAIRSVNGYLYFRGENNTIFTGTSGAFSCLAFSDYSGVTLLCSGSIESLLDWKTVGKGRHPVMGPYAFNYFFSGIGQYLGSSPEFTSPITTENCYSYFFYNCSNLINPPSVLPATEIAVSAYDSMFNGCTSLVTSPEFRATTVGAYGCGWMFYGCRSLQTAPELPAMNLGSGAYNYMFYNCPALRTAPALPATTLAGSVYKGMFAFSGITEAPSLPAQTPVSQCYNEMFAGCDNLTKAAVIPPANGAWNAYSYMYGGCMSLVISTTGTRKVYTGEVDDGNGNNTIFAGVSGITTTVPGQDYYND